MSLELAGNIAAALGGAVQGYQAQSDIEMKRKALEEDQKLKRLQLQAGLLEKGTQLSPDGGLVFTPEAEEEKKLDRQIKVFTRDKAAGDAIKTIGEASTKFGMDTDSLFGSRYKQKPGFIDPEKIKLEREQLEKENKLKTEEKDKLYKYETDLRKEFLGLPATKDMQTIDIAYNKIQNAAKTPSAANDMAIVFNFMKLQDPGSTVREGEYATAENARGVDQKLIGDYNKIVSGQRLSPDQRNMFLNSASNTYNASLQAYNKMAEQYKGLAKKGNLSPENVVPVFEQKKIGNIDPEVEAAKRVLGNPNAPELERKGAANFLKMKGIQ